MSINSFDENFSIVKPISIFDRIEIIDGFEMPVIKRDLVSLSTIEALSPFNNRNVKRGSFHPDDLILFFVHDWYLNPIWNNPLLYARKYAASCKYIGTPDFSIYPNMSKVEIYRNTYKNRYMGALFQNLGLTVFPTISWCDSSSYDICFSGVEIGANVIVSTIGCLKNQEMFLSGFNEMRKRIKPEYIFVYGSKIEGMKGNIKFLPYKDAFNTKQKQIDLFPKEKMSIQELV